MKNAFIDVIKNLSALIKVKTILSIMFSGALTVQFLNGNVSVEVYVPLVAMVMTYFFQKDKL